ncbi:hypothetical protein CFP56_038485 [Quercus suber]|uniref:Uncharacterized protein n=1 Tax=Quercus suber TaxID=58331 RepID=A0AAW0J1N5_QUESU
MAEGRPKCISKPPPCGTGGHKHGHKAGPEASDEEHARPPPRYTRQPKVQKSNNSTFLMPISLDSPDLVDFEVAGNYSNLFMVFKWLVIWTLKSNTFAKVRGAEPHDVGEY